MEADKELERILRDLAESTTPDGKYTILPKQTIEQAMSDIEALIDSRVVVELEKLIGRDYTATEYEFYIKDRLNQLNGAKDD